MAEAAAQSKTPVSSGLAYDDGVLLNQEGGKILDDATAKSLGGTQNEDNNMIQAQVVDESPEPPIAEFWGKYGEDVDGDDDNDKENELSDFIENVGLKVDGKGVSFDDILEGGETGEGFNDSGIVGIEAPAVEKGFEGQISRSENAGNEDGSVLGEADGDMTGSRKRKKSKYMCHPYTDLENLDAEIFTPKRGDYVEEDSEKITKSASVGERMKRAAAKLLGTSPIIKKKDGRTSAALSGSQSLADMETSPQEVLDHDKSVALDPNLGSDTCDMLINSISAYENAVYKEGSSKSSSFGISLGVDEEQKEKTLAEILREKKKEFKRAKKANNEGLVYIKEKLKKMTEMVDNCNGGDISSEWKASLEEEAKELLEKIGAMTAKPSSS